MAIAVPTLGTTTYLTDPTDIVPYIIRHYASVPKSTTHMWTNEVVSLRDTITQFQNTPDSLRRQIVNDLTEVFNRIFQNSGTNVSVDIEDIENNTAYNIIIEVTVFQNNFPFTLSNIILIEDGVPVVNNRGVR